MFERSYSSKSAAPGTRFVAAAALALGLSGCLVPRGRLDAAEARHAEEVSRHAATQRQLAWKTAHLAEAERQLAELERRIEARGAELAATESALAAKAFEVDQTTQEGEEAGQLVDQLRRELERTGAHITQLLAERDALQGELNELRLSADEGTPAAPSVLGAAHLTRVALALEEPLKRGQVALDERDGALVVVFAKRSLFASKATALTATGKRLLQGLGAALQPTERVLHLRSDASAPRAVSESRVRSAATELATGGVPPSNMTPQISSEATAADDNAAPADLVIEIRRGPGT